MFTTASDTNRQFFAKNTLLKVYVVLFALVWIYTFSGTTDLANWCIENLLTVLCLLPLFISHRNFQFSDLSYSFVFVFSTMHVYGSMYTYAENPFGFLLKDLFQLERNPYDRIVHFGMGFLLAYPLRDYLLNKFQWKPWMCMVFPIIMIKAFSGLYEIIEWLVADLFFPEQGHAYLGTQGDIWDAQKDMALAFVGAVLAIVITVLVKKVRKA